MKKLKELINDTKDFFDKKLKFLKFTNDKELEELKKTETSVKKSSKKEINVENLISLDSKSIWLFWLIWLFIVFIWYIWFKSLQIIYLVLAAYIISVAIEAVIDFFQRIKIARWLAIFLSYLIFILFILSWIIFIIPFLFTQLSELIKWWLLYLNDIQALLTTKSLPEIVHSLAWMPEYMQNYILQFLNSPDLVWWVQSNLQQNIAQLAQVWSSYAQTIWNWAVNFVSGIFNFIGQSAIVVTLAALFSIEKKSVIKFIANLWSLKSREYLVIRLEKIYKKLWIWLKSQLLLCVFIWLSVYLALWILAMFGIDLPSKWSLALISWLTEFIPYLWPILWWIAWVLVALIHYWISGAFVVLIIYFAIQRLENNVFIPLLMNKTLGVNPVVVFVSMLIWWLIMWFLWVLLAVPIAAIISLLVEKDE